jgi:hypothetical protein
MPPLVVLLCINVTTAVAVSACSSLNRLNLHVLLHPSFVALAMFSQITMHMCFKHSGDVLSDCRAYVFECSEAS